MCACHYLEIVPSFRPNPEVFRSSRRQQFKSEEWRPSYCQLLFQIIKECKYVQKFTPKFLFIKSRIRPFQFTPLEDGSPYDAAKLGFLFLSARGVFQLPPTEAFKSADFMLKEDAKSWPILCHVDQSSGTLNVSSPLVYAGIGKAMRIWRISKENGVLKNYLRGPRCARAA